MSHGSHSNESCPKAVSHVTSPRVEPLSGQDECKRMQANARGARPDVTCVPLSKLQVNGPQSVYLSMYSLRDMTCAPLSLVTCLCLTHAYASHMPMPYTCLCLTHAYASHMPMPHTSICLTLEPWPIHLELHGVLTGLGDRSR